LAKIYEKSRFKKEIASIVDKAVGLSVGKEVFKYYFWGTVAM
jgi:hypothetical protein